MNYRNFSKQNENCRCNYNFQKGDTPNISNFRSITVLSYFSKILRRIIYKKLYDFLRQFGFWAGLLTELTVLELIDQICGLFNNKNYLLGIFIDQSNVFNNVDCSILFKKWGIRTEWEIPVLVTKIAIKKLTIHWICEKYYNWVTRLSNTTYGVPQDSIFERLLFIVYVIKLRQISEFLKKIMFADKTNVFGKSKIIKNQIWQQT